MEASLDRHWLLGEPGWWGLGKELPPDFRPGELSPSEGWISSTPRIGNFGWVRQRMRPLAWSLLRPLAWAPFFLLLAALPLAFPGRTPNDQVFALSSFVLAWGLIFLPLIFSRNSQPMSDGTIFSLPVGWLSLSLASALFPLHALLDSRIGWASYILFWVAYMRTVGMVQESMRTPPARFLLPMKPEGWSGGLSEPWVVKSDKWRRGVIAFVECERGRLVISGASRGKDDFLSMAFVHSSGFVQDPFHETKSSDAILSSVLLTPIPLAGMEWPNRFVLPQEDE